MQDRQPSANETHEPLGFSWPSNRNWIFVDALTTTTSASIAGVIEEAILNGVSRLSRICCDVGIPHIVIGERVDSLSLSRDTLLAPALSLSNDGFANMRENFERAWMEGCSCSWSAPWEMLSGTGLPIQMRELLRQRLPQVLLYGGGDVPRFLTILDAFRSVSSRIWIVDDLVRREILGRDASPTICLATVERAYTDWCVVAPKNGK